MKDFEIWYAGMIIDNIQAETTEEALSEARNRYTTGSRGTVAVSKVGGTQEEINQAREASKELE